MQHYSFEFGHWFVCCYACFIWGERHYILSTSLRMVCSCAWKHYCCLYVWSSCDLKVNTDLQGIYPKGGIGARPTGCLFLLYGTTEESQVWGWSSFRQVPLRCASPWTSSGQEYAIGSLMISALCFATLTRGIYGDPLESGHIRDPDLIRSVETSQYMSLLWLRL